MLTLVVDNCTYDQKRKVILCATFVVYVRSVESLDRNLCRSLVCSSGRKPESTVKSILWVAVWNRIECRKKGVFHTFNSEKKKKIFSRRLPDLPLSGFLTFLYSHLWERERERERGWGEGGAGERGKADVYPCVLPCFSAWAFVREFVSCVLFPYQHADR